MWCRHQCRQCILCSLYRKPHNYYCHRYTFLSHKLHLLLNIVLTYYYRNYQTHNRKCHQFELKKETCKMYKNQLILCMQYSLKSNSYRYYLYSIEQMNKQYIFQLMSYYRDMYKVQKQPESVDLNRHCMLICLCISNNLSHMLNSF